jgi:hypothetical protein
MGAFSASGASSRLFNATHLAVASGEGDPGGLLELSRGEFYGTAFPLSAERFLFATPLHVYREAAANGEHVAIGRVMSPQPQPVAQLVVKSQDVVP